MLTVENTKFDFRNITLPECVEGNAKDAYFTLKLFYSLKEKLDSLKLTKLVEDLLVDMSKIFGDIEYSGMAIDVGNVDQLRKTLKAKIRSKEDSIYSIKGLSATDNLSSNQNMSEILYTREGSFELYPPDMTNGGSPSVSADTIDLLLSQIEGELEARALKNGKNNNSR